jgi:Purple acid Phosphatase, N-terminal domain/Calcineurin-like phosphoesterase
MIAAGTGLITATATAPARAGARGRPDADGTPEQVHLTWGDDPTQAVVVSWASPGQAERPRVRIGQRVITAAERTYTDTRSGAVTWTYHARVDGLRPGATYGYAVTADNDANAADPFSATFTTAPQGRAAFRFTSFGDLATPNPAWASSRRSGSIAPPADLPRGVQGVAPPEENRPAAYAVGAVETFQPLFHLLNGDLAYAARNPDAPNPADWAQVWRDFGNNVQASAANRPWLPVPGNHEMELGNGDQGLASFLTRYTLPSNGTDGLEGRWYAFRVGTALFVCLSGDDVAYQDAGAFVAGPAPLLSDPATGNPPVPADTSRYVRGYSGGAQTRWLESTLAAARADASLDWVVVQVHQCACSSAPDGNGSDLGIRREWLPLFDAFEVDLVLSGHDHGYERSFPVRGFDADAGTDAAGSAVTDTSRPRPVTTVDSGVFDTSQGTVHLVLGCGGSATGPGAHEDTSHESTGAGSSPRLARVITRPNTPVPDPRVPGGYTRPDADAVEAATWSARRDTATGYGIAVFDVSPGSEAGGQTSITVRYYHAVGAEPTGPGLVGTRAGTGGGTGGAPTDDYTLFETFTLVRPRSDGRRWHLKA